MIRFGIVGAKGIAQKFARDIKFVKNAKLTAVSARSFDQAKIYQEMYNSEYAFSSYEEMAKSSVIDAVYIATPHNFHYNLAILFMKNKKHVLVEKPIAVNQIEYQKMIDCARKNQVLLMEAMWTSFLPSTTYVKNLIASNECGKLLSANISKGYKLIENYPSDGRLLNLNLAGGSLLDLGIYPLSFYNLIKQSSVKTLDANALFTETGVDSEVNVFIVDDLNAKISIKSSFNDNLVNDALLVFENCTIKMINFSRCEKLFINDKEISLPFDGEGFVDEIRSFCDSIINHETENKTMNFEQTKETLELMDSIRAVIGLKYPFE
ncbi:MAG: Gfo/Idh/MocA family protein [Candidatus Izemoplasmatales bacterium]